MLAGPSAGASRPGRVDGYLALTRTNGRPGAQSLFHIQRASLIMTRSRITAAASGSINNRSCVSIPAQRDLCPQTKATQKAELNIICEIRLDFNKCRGLSNQSGYAIVLELGQAHCSVNKWKETLVRDE